jgi:hypothetical protein
MKRLIEIKSISKESQLEISVWLTDICNYDCSYCFPNSKDGIYRYQQDYDLFWNRFKNLLKFYEKKFSKTSFLISICGGGEPTLFPYFQKFCKDIKSEFNSYIRLITNGSRTLRWWEENYHFLDEVLISVHSEFCDTDHIIKVADFLTKNKVQVSALLMMDLLNWDKCIENYYKLFNSKYSWIIESKPIFDSPGRDINDYNEDQIRFINSIKRIDTNLLLNSLDKINPYKSIAIFDNGDYVPKKQDGYSKLNNFFNWKCSVLLSELLITVDGKIHARCEKIPLQLNLYDDDFLVSLENFDLSVVKCPQVICEIPNNHHFSKKKF